MIDNQIINKTIDFIISHIEENLTIEDISKSCGFSKFYLDRLFKAETGESLYAFIKRVRVEQSALRLKIEKNRSITEICSDYGYSSSNYATLFKNYFNESPAHFRKRSQKQSTLHPFLTGQNNILETYEECCKKISIQNLPDYFVLYERHKGNYKNISTHWCDFIDRYKDFISPKTIFIERTMDDPTITYCDECIYEVCMTIDKNDVRLTAQKTAAAGITSIAGTKAGPSTMKINGGKFAVYHYTGYPQLIYAAYQSFFCNWLRETGNRIDSRCGYDIYRKIDTETMYLEMDICIPII